MVANGLSYSDFTAFFQALWGYGPFPWQERLMARLVTGEDISHDYKYQPGVWPDVLDLPTGSGKTAVLDVAVFHLALQALDGQARHAPVRIIFVVDRRLIVDDAFRRARQIQASLNWSLLEDSEAKKFCAEHADLAQAVQRVRVTPIMKQVARRLARLAGEGGSPLLVRRLRGGAPLEDDWARTPVQPTILCSTVDQVGSRLLFRGYGVSNSMKPIHAGLLGSDCLILLDEAHIAEPFRQTLKSIERLREPDKSPFRVALLTATPSAAAERLFSLSPQDHSHPVLSRRITISKPARLIEILGKQGVDTEVRRVDAVCEATKSVISNLRDEGVPHPAVAVVVNRVARARTIFDRLTKDIADAEAILLVGPARSIDRDQITSRLDSIRTGNPDVSRTLGREFIVVATQTIEAGVDLDFDGLVTEAASLDALRQRFGRLNRAGRSIAPKAILLAHKDDLSTKAADPVYGDRIARTWEALVRLKESRADDLVDFGINAMDSAFRNVDLSKLVAVSKPAPVLMPSYAHLWSHTSPIPNADPEIALFLHGTARSPAGVQIVWRADIRERDLRLGSQYRDRLIELLKLLPPRVSEAVEVPIWIVRAWLNRVQTSDFSDAVEGEPQLDEREQSRRLAFRWAGPNDDKTEVIPSAAIRPGDMIVVPAIYGGCDEWGWTAKMDSPVFDKAEAALWPYRTKRFAVRVTPELIIQRWKESEGKQEDGIPADRSTFHLDVIYDALKTKLAETASSRTLEVLDAISEMELPGHVHLPKQLRDELKLLKAPKGWLAHEFPYGFDEEERPRGIVFVAPRGLKGPESEESIGTPATESEEMGSASDMPIPLIAHCKDVRHFAEAFAARAGLGPKQTADLLLAAFLHDAGKADPRYQSYFMGGDPYGPEIEHVLAKSGQRRLPRGAWARAGLPSDWRHEGLSVRLTINHPNFSHAYDPELVLWLIGTHHGFGRPLFPHADDKDDESRSGLLKAYGVQCDLEPGSGPQSLGFEFNGRDWPQLFEYLKQRYGTWGLARLESFIRLADHRASEGARDTGEPLREAAE